MGGMAQAKNADCFGGINQDDSSVQQY